MSGVAERLERVREQVRDAALAAGRDPSAVRLLAVSKGHPSSALREAYAAGQRDFGENYAQELAKKAEALGDLPDLRLHMIGHLQRNKAKYVARHAFALQSLDSEELARELDKRVQGRVLPVLVEVSIAGEGQKSGVDPARLGELLSTVERCPNLALRGLMCIPPQVDDPGKSRSFFQALRRLQGEHGGAERLPELSMGMSADFEWAIPEGATWVRVGTAIFGERPARAAAEAT